MWKKYSIEQGVKRDSAAFDFTLNHINNGDLKAGFSNIVT